MSTTALALEVGVSPASATSMVKKLAGLGLVEHEPYHGTTLTASGERVALEVVRHHRLLELYLMESLGLGWDEVHAEAERLEHYLSEELEARIDAALGHPTRDPHGDPIPTAELTLMADTWHMLSEVEDGGAAIIRRVPDDDPELLRYLASLGLVPDQPVTVVERAPFEGPLTVSVGQDRRAIGRALAARIEVEPVA
jgi:DtxR family Mn-dependent transcriptional regulator